VRERRADRHLHPLPDTPAQRMHARARLEDLQKPIAPRAVGNRDVAHPVVIAANHPLQRFHEALVRAKAFSHIRCRGFACGREIAGE
jgi:hypothetical protein